MTSEAGGSLSCITTGTGTVSATASISSRWNFCPECGKKIEAEWKYCSGCGRAVGFFGGWWGYAYPYYPTYSPYITYQPNPYITYTAGGGVAQCVLTAEAR